MSDSQLHIVSWNTRGYGQIHRRRTIRKFLTGKHNRNAIILLQELKVRDKVKLETSLRAIRRDAYIEVDYTVSGRGGAAIIIPTTYKVRSSGTSGTGNAVWAEIETSNGPLHIMSIHAPNSKEDMTTFWENLQNQIQGQRWILGGDYNMVELWDNSSGKSAIIAGSEARAWKSFSQSNGLVDSYLAAASRKGGNFTRHAFYGRRYDQSRLDRFYVSQGGEWLHLIREVIHHSEQVISDHIPVSLHCDLSQSSQTDWKPKTYHKMDATLLSRPGVMDRIKEVWQNHPQDCGNPQRKWQLAWLRIKKILIQEKSKQDEERRLLCDERVELFRLRCLPQQGNSAETLQRIAQLEHQTRLQDLNDAKAWRTRSKNKWLREGEAPSRYFYSQLKAKQYRESIQSLTLPDGQTTTDRSRILTEVERFMKELYTRQECSDQVRRSRQEALSHISKTITPEQDTKICVKPGQDEIENAAKLMKNDKSSGLDGLTTEILMSCWQFIRDDCFNMVNHFWDQGDYKLIAKIMAERIKKLLPLLVDDQQTGFIKGRNISTNILSLHLGRDWARISGQNILFLKLDFFKAYDRIEQGFLLDTLSAMGFSQESITIFKGLCTKGKAKIHINQDFTKTFDVQRGVRQGCPLAPYLFTLCTQVLMEMLKSQQQNGNITGLRVGDSHTLLHQLFADDTGIFLQVNEDIFNNTMDTLSRFEEASGAKLNLAKSTVIPLGTEQLPQWLRDTQCTIASPSDRLRYLGLLTGTDVVEEELITDLKVKYEKHLNHWFSRLLSWPERALLAQNVLRTLPNYTLMTLGLSVKATHVLEKITSTFIWGKDNTRRSKKPLIAWATFARRKKDGGLRWPDMKEMADAFLLKNVSTIIRGEEHDWTIIANAIISHKLQHSSRPWEIKCWSPSTLLLGLNALRIPDSQVLDRMLRSWFKVKKHLGWNPDNGHFPITTTPTFAINLLQMTDTADAEEINALKVVFRKTKIFSFADLQDNESRPSTIHHYCNTKGILITLQAEITATNKIEAILPIFEAGPIQWHQAAGWFWRGLQGDVKSPWKLSTHQWRHLLYTRKDEEDHLNMRWDCHQPTLTWKKRWALLWGGTTNRRTKVRVWRHLRRGYFTNSKARDWNVGSGLCCRCHIEHETLQHTFWTCPRLIERQRWLSWLLFPDAERTTSNATGEPLISIIDRTLEFHIVNPAPLLLLLTIWRTNWSERNDLQFNETTKFKALSQILKETEDELNAGHFQSQYGQTATHSQSGSSHHYLLSGRVGSMAER
ncbi:hypothetical protein R1sor_010975 [Riccia sorocarpa]|uniref:Reverse transcriptase domain-containing protein n=1 Tax=Riccia sorocarpa TaxID=122646 RepID=A0ABD3I307_9MARC